MTSLASRTAYVVLAAIENEFRAVVDRYAGDEPPSSLLSEDLIERTDNRRKREHHVNSPQTVSQLLTYLDFQDGFELAMRLDARAPEALTKGLKANAPQVQQVVPVRNRVAHNRPLQIDDLPHVVDLADALCLIDGWDWPDLKSTISQIQHDSGYIFRVSANLLVDPDSAVANNLPVPDFDETSLLGRRDERRNLLRALRGAWPVISILGDGGIGKTALALQVCYDLIEQSDCPFEAVVWVSAKNSQLTSTEIVRIESAVEDSLGLFASAAAEVGGSGVSETAIDELLEILESFPTLLVLDNVETVLDESFPRFLREVPVGSKVLITSRIGVKTENPFKLSGLSEDDAVVLMRILARTRNIKLAAIAGESDLLNWARRMKCHPAYIKWFMSGLQTGQSPEKLLNDNGLVLEFCMSNVFKFLGDPAKGTLRAMLIVPGAHTMAELATLTQMGSSQIQEVILELTTTNFVAHVRGGASGSALELSDFARDYLRRTLQVSETERRDVLDRHKHLYAIGGGLKAAHALDPYDPATIDIRGVGDYYAAKLLRDAVEQAIHGNIDKAIHLCSEASELAPGYHEASRVEAYVRELSANFWEASEAYSRAKDLAPEDQYVAYFFGRFLVSSGFDSGRGIRELQRAAQLDPAASRVHLAIAEAFSQSQRFSEAMDAAIYALRSVQSGSRELSDILFALWQNCAFNILNLLRKKSWSKMAENIDDAWAASKSLDNDAFDPATLDLILWVEDMLKPAKEAEVDVFVRKRISALVAETISRRIAVDPNQDGRLVGTVATVKSDAGYGFIKHGADQFFFHARELWEQNWFFDLRPGSILLFTPGPAPAQGRPKALSVHWVG